MNWPQAEMFIILWLYGSLQVYQTVHVWRAIQGYLCHVELLCYNINAPKWTAMAKKAYSEGDSPDTIIGFSFLVPHSVSFNKPFPRAWLNRDEDYTLLNPLCTKAG